jgi:hypothetical protein
VADVGADAKLMAAAIVIDDKDKQLRDKDQLVREKDEQSQFMVSQMEDMMREKIAALQLAACPIVICKLLSHGLLDP